MGTLPLQNNFSLNGRAGLCWWDDGFGGTHTIGAVETPEETFSDGTDPVVGLGASYDFGNNIFVRAEWERYFNVIHDNEDADLISISIMTRF